MRTIYNDIDDELTPVLAAIDKAIKVSSVQPCHTPFCRPDAMEDVRLGSLPDESSRDDGHAFGANGETCVACQIHFLLETAAGVARYALEQAKLQ